jgi:hypothetical protein
MRVVEMIEAFDYITLLSISRRMCRPTIGGAARRPSGGSSRNSTAGWPEGPLQRKDPEPRDPKIAQLRALGRPLNFLKRVT